MEPTNSKTSAAQNRWCPIIRASHTPFPLRPFYSLRRLFTHSPSSSRAEKRSFLEPNNFPMNPCRLILFDAAPSHNLFFDKEQLREFIFSARNGHSSESLLPLSHSFIIFSWLAVEFGRTFLYISNVLSQEFLHIMIHTVKFIFADANLTTRWFLNWTRCDWNCCFSLYLLASMSASQCTA